MAKTAQEKGYVFEDWVQDKVLQPIQEYKRGAFHRFYDTKSAEGFLPSQPGDFLVMRGGRSMLIECKTSTVETTLTRAYISKSVGVKQVARMSIWMRAGIGGVYLFESSLSGLIEVWGGAHIVEVKNTPRMPPDFSFMPYTVDSGDKTMMQEILLHLLENQQWLK